MGGDVWVCVRVVSESVGIGGNRLWWICGPPAAVSAIRWAVRSGLVEILLDHSGKVGEQLVALADEG